MRAIIVMAKLACQAYCCCSSEAGAKRDRPFKKHPKLRRAHERALAATWALYQAIGRAQVDVD